MDLDFILFIKAAFLGMIQGITEFIPVSSTGHMVILGKLLNLEGEFVSTFDVFIQLGATCALIWYFRKDFFIRLKGVFSNLIDRQFFWYLFVAFLPIAIIGLLFHKKFEILLGSALAVGIAQILGGLFILFAESKSKNYLQKTDTLNEISFKQALSVGFWQILSLWPGMSRSGSTIMGGLLSKIDRPTATQFSFYLSIPVSFASSFFILFKHKEAFLIKNNVLLLGIGFFAAFFVGIFVIKFIMNYVKTHSFVPFAYYRLMLGILIIALVFKNVI